MGHVIIYYIGCVFDRALHTKETQSNFVKLWIPVNKTQRYGIQLQYPQAFRRLIGDQWTPEFWGVIVSTVDIK